MLFDRGGAVATVWMTLECCNAIVNQWRFSRGAGTRVTSTPCLYRQAIDLIKPRFVFAPCVLIILLNTACKSTDSFFLDLHSSSRSVCFDPGVTL